MTPAQAAMLANAHIAFNDPDAAKKAEQPQGLNAFAAMQR